MKVRIAALFQELAPSTESYPTAASITGKETFSAQYRRSALGVYSLSHP